MNPKSRSLVALAMVAGALLNSVSNCVAASAPDPYEKQLRDAASARGKDAAWNPTTTEVALIQVGDAKRPGALRNYCLDADGNILACFAPQDASAASKSATGIRVYSPDGKLIKTWPLEIKPTAIAVAKDRSIFVAGEGRLLKLDAAGKVLASAMAPSASEPVVITKEIEEMVKQMVKQTKQPYDAEIKRMKASLEKRRADVTGLAATEQDVFMVLGSPSDFSYRVYRFDHALASPKLVVDKLRGCCSTMDLQAHDGKLWIPHNGRHLVETRDRDGNELAKFGKSGKVKPDDFGGCCEPKCMRVLPNGDILTAESGPPTSIKRFSADGKLLEVVAVIETKGDCVRVTVEKSPDGSRYYLLDTTRDAIRLFKAKG